VTTVCVLYASLALDLTSISTSVIHYETPWGYSEYEVLGSTTTYTVLVDLKTAQVPYSCTCPAFTFNVLMSGTHVMVWLYFLLKQRSCLTRNLQCKHVLATLISRAMGLSTRRPAKADDLAFLYCQRHPLSSSEPEDMQT